MKICLLFSYAPFLVTPQNTDTHRIWLKIVHSIRALPLEGLFSPRLSVLSGRCRGTVMSSSSPPHLNGSTEVVSSGADNRSLEMLAFRLSPPPLFAFPPLLLKDLGSFFGYSSFSLGQQNDKVKSIFPTFPLLA